MAAGFKKRRAGGGRRQVAGMHGRRARWRSAVETPRLRSGEEFAIAIIRYPRKAKISLIWEDRHDSSLLENTYILINAFG
ncbi:hypothetical protein CRG98_027655 [Punica granatum]|uniref:Uncharacterized protein n=1 Tax=Punica granatum TaxID=22663 RepID=A0A2I0J7H3_PUNGR|nr:hypothetical protein CRG98_027655 [Punica granatum]